MRSKHNVVRADANLLEQLARMTMAEYAIRREIVGSVHVVRLCRRCLACAAHSALRIGDDAMGQVNEARRNQWTHCKNDRSGIATWIRNQPRTGDLAAVQLRQPIDSLPLC